MMRRAATLGAIALGVLTLVGCEETNECRQLKKLKGEYEQAAVQMRARAGLVEKAEQRAKAAEDKAKKKLESLGLDKSETDLDAILRDRAEALGATLDRGTREVPLGNDGATEKQTLWSFELNVKDTATAVDQARRLAGSPPMFRYVALLGDGKSWRFRLGKAQVDQIDLSKLQPTPPPERRKVADIPSELGFCGASTLRSELAALESEIETLEEKAAQTTILMPKAASWEGVRRRTLQMQAEEAEARAILDDLLTAAVRARVPLKAAGVEGPVVILELRGGPKERTAFQKHLPPKALAELKPAPTERPGLIRYMMLIPAADARRRGGDQHGPERHGPEPHGPGGH